MESKKCTKCGEVKQIECFSKDKGKKDGYQTLCKSCIKQYYEENKERINERKKQYREENKERILKRQKQYYEKNKERRKQYNQENKERKAEYNKQYSQENKERRAELNKQWRKENKERILERNKQWRKENKEYLNERRKQRKITDPLYKLAGNLRSRTCNAFKSKSYLKTSKTAEMLGVPYKIAFAHIER